MKFSGMVGFWIKDAEVKTDVYRPMIVEKPYFGDVIEDRRRFVQTEHQNDDLTLNNRISILADTYAQRNWSSIKYVVWNGVKWKVTSVTVGYPRLTLEIGGVYNGTETATIEYDTTLDHD